MRNTLFLLSTLLAVGCGSADGSGDVSSGSPSSGTTQRDAGSGGGGDGGGGGLSGDPGNPGPTTPACTEGSKEFAEAGTFTFDVPAFATMTVEVWGGGGGGEASGAGAPHATAGGASSFDKTIVGGGGGPGTDCCGGAAGTASGGSENLIGAAGGPGIHYPTIGGDSAGGTAPKGGVGGRGRVAPTDGCGGGDGAAGAAPGGGGAPSWTCQGTWWTGTGWGDTGGSGGSGGYAKKEYAAGSLSAKSVEVVVGAGGKGSMGQVSSGYPVTAKNPGHYTAGDGGTGKVEIVWTCPTGAPPANPK